MSALVFAHALPYVNWIILVTLAAGTFAFVAIAAELTDATRGYLGFTSFCASLLAGLALVADRGLPPPSELTIMPADPSVTTIRQAALAAFAASALVYTFVVRRRRGQRSLAVLALGAASVTLAAAAVGWAPTLADSVPFVIQLGVLAAASGGSVASLVLGHWYLVTPRLSERPLVLLTRLLTAVVALQLGLFVTWTTLGGGPGQQPFEALTGEAAVFVWLRLIVGLAFPLALSWMALQTARSRSMESATGLLYIGLAAIASGTIAAAALYTATGLLV